MRLYMQDYVISTAKGKVEKYSEPKKKIHPDNNSIEIYTTSNEKGKNEKKETTS